MKREATCMMSYYHLPRVFVFLTLLSTTLVSANDGAYYASGNQIIPLQETDISVKNRTP